MENDKKEGQQYAKFFVMIATSMTAMFLLMYTHSYQIIDHFWFSETRLFMTIIMGGSMVIIMLLFMLNMYTNKKINLAILSVGILMIVAGIGFVRVRKLADDIIKAQRKEIMEMEWLIKDIKANGIVETAAEMENRPLPTFEGKLDEETKNIDLD